MPRHPDSARDAPGFTLIELLVVLGVVAVLACVALPAFSGAAAKAHAGAAKVAFGETWLAAVRHSALTGTEVVVCPAPGGGCEPGVDWSRGWIAFADNDGDRLQDPAERVLERVEALDGGIRLRSTPGRQRLVFQPGGGNAGSNVTFTLCRARDLDSASTLVMSNEGRLRQGTPTGKAARECAFFGAD